MPEFDERTEKNLMTLLPLAQEQAREFMRSLKAAGIPARIISGTRTYAEQDALYAQGRTQPGSIVTNARAGYSNHNFGIAWDIGIFSGGTYQPESPLYTKAGIVGRELGLDWGGDWKTIVDRPHFQCKTGLTLAQLRALHNQGKPIPIPPLSGVKVVPTPATDSNHTKRPVEIYLNGVLQKIPAVLLSNQTWIAVRPFTVVFGGEVTGVGGEPFMVSVSVADRSKNLAGQIIEGTGYVKFADLNALYRLKFIADGAIKITK